jgi:hypothetical protein
MSTQAAEPIYGWRSLFRSGVGKYRDYKYFTFVFLALIAFELIGTYGIIQKVPCMSQFRATGCTSN